MKLITQLILALLVASPALAQVALPKSAQDLHDTAGATGAAVPAKGVLCMGTEGGTAAALPISSGTVPVSGNLSGITEEIAVYPDYATVATLSNVNDTATSTTILASNANRRGATIVNDS